MLLQRKKFHLEFLESLKPNVKFEIYFIFHDDIYRYDIYILACLINFFS